MGLALGTLFRFGNTLLFTTALASPTADTWLGPLGQPVVTRTVVVAGSAGSLEADRYEPPRPSRALVLVHGLSPAGRRHPELVRLARLLARQGQLVLVPQFPGLASFRLGGREVAEVGTALDHLAPRGLPLAVAGFSFGAGPALLAAAQRQDIAVAGSFGGYADLRHVILYVTTGVHAFGAQRYVQRQQEYNRWKLLALLAGLVPDRRDAERLAALARRRLANPEAPGEDLERGLGAQGRAVLALVHNRLEDRVPGLLAALPARARQALDALSPLEAVRTLRARLVLAHGRGDDSIPFTESLRLAAAAGPRARLALLETFHHTGPQPLWQSAVARARDGVALVSVVDALLGR